MWWVEYQVNGVRHRQSTHTRKYNVAKAWAAQIDTARKMPTFEEAVKVLKMFYKQPVEGLLPIDSAWDVYMDLAKATGKASISSYTMNRRKCALQRFIDWVKKYRATVKTIEGVTGPIALEQTNGDAIRNTAFVKQADTASGTWIALDPVTIG